MYKSRRIYLILCIQFFIAIVILLTSVFPQKAVKWNEHPKSEIMLVAESSKAGVENTDKINKALQNYYDSIEQMIDREIYTLSHYHTIIENTSDISIVRIITQVEKMPQKTDEDYISVAKKEVEFWVITQKDNVEIEIVTIKDTIDELCA